MTVTNLPCGCILKWGDDVETDLAFCEEHDVQYEKWHGDDLEFIKMVATPHYEHKAAQKVLVHSIAR